jgi:capsule polysaccharide export protein KpsE/RkpR
MSDISTMETAMPEAPDAQPAAQQPTLAEIIEVIDEFTKYRERLLNDTLDAAKKAKLSKQATLAKLEPELAQIDAVLTQLRSQQAELEAQA